MAFSVKERRKKYTSNQKFGVEKDFYSLLFSPRLHLFDQKYSKNANIMKYNYNLK